MLMRIAKFLSGSGLASRRKSEEFILEGKVAVNGIIVKDLTRKIDTEKDEIKLFNKKITIDKKVYIALNKPSGYLSTTKDDFKRKTILDLIGDIRHDFRLFPVGRLDLHSRGLILLTNDGDFALRATHPKFMIEKTYELIINKTPSDEDLRKIKKGIIIEGKKVNVSKLSIKLSGNADCKIIITIHEGRKRILRRLFGILGYEVKDLKRVKIGNLPLGNLQEGRYRILDEREIKKVFEDSNNDHLN